jgi:hypothetical protein
MMVLKKNKYIVSGLERSGTSMMMQILEKGGVPVAFDRKRKPNVHNPKGYYELAGGKIINQLMQGIFPFENYIGVFIKITAYGLKFLPQSPHIPYKVIYMVRNLDEIMASMEKMSGAVNWEDERQAFENLNIFVFGILKSRKDIDYLIIDYYDVIQNPKKEIARIDRFIGGGLDQKAAMQTVDPALYRNIKKR